METETCKLYSRVFWIFLPNFIKIDPYNFWAMPFQSWCTFWDTVHVQGHIRDNHSPPDSPQLVSQSLSSLPSSILPPVFHSLQAWKRMSHRYFPHTLLVPSRLPFIELDLDRNYCSLVTRLLRHIDYTLAVVQFDFEKYCVSQDCNREFAARPISRYISETVQTRTKVTLDCEYEILCDLSNDLEWQ